MEVLEYDMQAEQASALGAAGRKVERALARLAAYDAEQRVATDEAARRQRQALVDTAAGTVWALFIQRDILGLRRQSAVIRLYGIPREVLNRVGVSRSPAHRR